MPRVYEVKYMLLVFTSVSFQIHRHPGDRTSGWGGVWGEGQPAHHPSETLSWQSPPGTAAPPHVACGAATAALTLHREPKRLDEFLG